MKQLKITPGNNIEYSMKTGELKKGMKRLTEEGHAYSCAEVFADFDSYRIAQCLNQLSDYEDTGLTPDQIREIDRLYSEKCRELSVSMENFKALSERMDAEEHGCFCWIPVEELLPEPHTDVIVAVQEFGEETEVLIDCLVEMESGKYGWGTYNGALERVTAWMPLPEPYQAE